MIASAEARPPESLPGMQIEIEKRAGRNRLACVRSDGSYTSADVGPGLPYHDLAHYVVETRLELRHGFYGHVLDGLTLQALSDKAVIRTLGAEAWTAETLAGALGALASGAATPDQFCEIVNAQLAMRGLPRLEILTEAVATSLLGEFRALIARYDALADGGSLRLEFV